MYSILYIEIVVTQKKGQKNNEQNGVRGVVSTD